MDDVFDERGVLKDRRCFRVDLKLLDGLQREVAEQYAVAEHQVHVAAAIHHRPGFVRDMRSVLGGQRIYDEYDLSVANAWKSPGRRMTLAALSFAGNSTLKAVR